MTTIAVISTGGKQYTVKKGDIVDIEKLPAQEGDSVQLDALLISNEDGSSFSVGTPSAGKVEAKVVSQYRDKKVIVGKFKAKVRYRRKAGHRQELTKVEITKI